MSTKNVRNIKAIHELATAGEIASGKAWYPVANDIAKVVADQYSIHSAEAAGVLAALSPRNSHKQNVIHGASLTTSYVEACK
mgnify:CR=1 FL=1